MAKKTGTFVPNTQPETESDSATESAKVEGRASDANRTDVITSLTGQPLEGDDLARFQAVYDTSKTLQAAYNPDGSIKADTKKIME